MLTSSLAPFGVAALQRLGPLLPVAAQAVAARVAQFRGASTMPHAAAAARKEAESWYTGARVARQTLGGGPNAVATAAARLEMWAANALRLGHPTHAMQCAWRSGWRAPPHGTERYGSCWVPLMPLFGETAPLTAAPWHAMPLLLSLWSRPPASVGVISITRM